MRRGCDVYVPELKAVIPRLAEHYTVIAPDLLGPGQSAKPVGDYSLGAYVNYTCPKDAAEILLDHLAKMGQGAVAYLGLNDDGVKVMDEFFERISHPALTDIKVDW